MAAGVAVAPRARCARVRAARAAALAADPEQPPRGSSATCARPSARPPGPPPRRPRGAAPVDIPKGGWAIPWEVVQCESGGQNLPPNSAGASGYYQIMPATWKGLGGKGPHAYLRPKAEQDAPAAKLWAGGAGARNWV